MRTISVLTAPGAAQAVNDAAPVVTHSANSGLGQSPEFFADAALALAVQDHFDAVADLLDWNSGDAVPFAVLCSRVYRASERMAAARLSVDLFSLRLS